MALSKKFSGFTLQSFYFVRGCPFCLLRDTVLELVGRLVTDGLIESDVEVGSVVLVTVRFVATTGVGLHVVGVLLDVVVLSNIGGVDVWGVENNTGLLHWSWVDSSSPSFPWFLKPPSQASIVVGGCTECLGPSTRSILS